MIFENILLAVQELSTLETLLFMSIGTLAGLVAGAIPGFTIAMAIVLTLPFTFSMPPAQGLATMMGVFVGGLSGGLMSGILTGIPGTPSSVATTFDGFPMARNGRPGLALGIGVWASFFGGTISAVLLVTLAPQLAQIGLEFQPSDYFMLVLFALTITASLAGENLTKGLIAGALGLLIATIGEDEASGIARFTFGFDDMRQGFSFLPVLIGLFAFSQLLTDLEDRVKAKKALSEDGSSAVRVEHLAAIKIVLSQWVNLLRSSFIGVFTGVLPAAGSSISNILAYDQAKKASKTPEKFGTGCAEGIVAPESANNATAGGALITMMALGIPGDIVTAVMLGALLIHDVVPSPSFVTEEPVLAYSMFLAFFVANFLMIALQPGALRLFVLVTKVRMYILAAIILAYCGIGVFALNNIEYDMWTLFLFGILGYVLRKLGFPLAPIILGVVLGHIAELWLARATAISTSVLPFIIQPWSMFFLILAVFSVFFSSYQDNLGKKTWTLFYTPALTAAMSVPMFLMQGTARPILGVILLLLSGFLLNRARQQGWKVNPADAEGPRLLEG